MTKFIHSGCMPSERTGEREREGDLNYSKHLIINLNRGKQIPHLNESGIKLRNRLYNVRMEVPFPHHFHLSLLEAGPT